MSRINTIVIETRLTRDPEIKEASGGLMVAKLGLVHNIGKKDKHTGLWTNEPFWLDGLAFGKTATSIGKLTKGNQIVVSGSLSQDTWTDKTTGQPRFKTVLMIDRFDQLDRQNGPKAGGADDADAADGGRVEQQVIPF